MSAPSWLGCLEEPAALTLAERLNHTLDLLQWNSSPSHRTFQLAKIADIAEPLAFAWLNGLARPNAAQLKKLASHFKINADWLSSGIGAPIIGPHPKSGLSSLPLIELEQAHDYAVYLRPGQWVRDRFAVQIECSTSSFTVQLEKAIPSALTPRTTTLVVDPLLKVNEGLPVLIQTRSKKILYGSLHIEDDKRELAQENGKRQALRPSDKIIGTVVAIVNRFN